MSLSTLKEVIHSRGPCLVPVCAQKVCRHYTGPAAFKLFENYVEIQCVPAENTGTMYTGHRQLTVVQTAILQTGTSIVVLPRATVLFIDFIGGLYCRNVIRHVAYCPVPPSHFSNSL
ncbi:unnamed protein product, partial [Ectocarpus sp. 6 AP-2014]